MEDVKKKQEKVNQDNLKGINNNNLMVNGSGRQSGTDTLKSMQFSNSSNRIDIKNSIIKAEND